MASPELQWAIDTIARDRARAGVTADTFDPEAARASLPPSELPDPDGTAIREIDLDGLACFWIIPPGADSSRRLVYLHGGGYVTGSFRSHRPLVTWLAAAFGGVALFPEYRLVPESRYPAQLDDTTAALRHAFEHGPDARAPSHHVVAAGDSVGGALAIGAMLRRRDARDFLPAAAALFCAMLDLDERTSPFLASTRRMRDTARLYVDRLDDLTDPLANVMLADLKGLPPLLIQTGSADQCRPDCLRFAERARGDGVPVTLEDWPEMIHVWQRFAPKLPEARDALERAGAFLRKHACDQ